MVNAMDRLVFPLVASDIRKEFDFTVADTGLIATIFTLGMAVAGWPTGYLITRLSRKVVVQVGILIFSSGTVLIALASGFFDMLLYRALTGVGEAMQQIALITIATSYFVRSRTLAIATTQVAFGAGNMVGPLLASTVVVWFGSWRGPFYIFGLAGFVMMAVVALLVSSKFTEARGEKSPARLVGGATVLSNRNTIILSVITLLSGPIIYGYLGLYSTYLREQIHLPPQDVAVVMSFFGFGGLMAPVGGWLGDKFTSRTLLVVGFLLQALLGYLLYAWAIDFKLHCTLSFLWGFAASGIVYTNLWSAHIKSVGMELAPKASGLFIALFYTTSAFGGYLMGFFVSLSGWATAGTIQITFLAVVCAILTMLVKTAQMSVPVFKSADEV